MNKDNALRNSIVIAVSFVAIIWALKLVALAFGMDLYQLGIYPRIRSGLPGILTAPFIHGSWQHLIGNTLPTVLLGSMLIYGYPKSRYWALAGVFLAWAFRNWDPKPGRKRYSWERRPDEGEAAEEEDCR